MNREEEFNRVYEKYGSKMFRVCMYYIKDEDEAKDVFQNALIKVHKKLETYREEGSFEGWLRRIFVNTALNHIKQSNRDRFVSMEDVDKHELMVASRFEPSDSFAMAEIKKEINKLPNGYRTVFNLFSDGYMHQEIATMLNISENTSKSQYSRARHILSGMVSRY